MDDKENIDYMKLFIDKYGYKKDHLISSYF